MGASFMIFMFFWRQAIVFQLHC